MNEQIEDQPESRTADGYKSHLELLDKGLKSKGRQTVYTACMIWQCLSEIKQKYQGNKKPFHMSNQTFTSIFSLTCLISWQLIIGFRVSRCRLR